ncbi:MAG: PilZ domain-containing protein [Bdellovibrionaceae bacterium]|nr:PilZ domain-containing protein [Pseudobdellovibrionaceae bacterium]
MTRRWFATALAWSLYNPLKGWTLHGLSNREARLLLQTLSLAEKRVLWLWHEGWTEWRHLDAAECDSLSERLDCPDPGAPKLPEFVGEDETTAVRSSSYRPARRSWGRESERCAINVPAEIVQGPQTFRTRTENVSMGGIKFTDQLPDWLAGYFTVILGLPKGQIEVTCMLVEDQKNAKTRVEVVETDDEESHLPTYRDWVKSLG